MIHKPHPGNLIKGYAMKQVLNDLMDAGFINEERSIIMNTLRYKGFIGSVNFSEEDSVFR